MRKPIIYMIIQKLMPKNYKYDSCIQHKMLVLQLLLLKYKCSLQVIPFHAKSALFKSKLFMAVHDSNTIVQASWGFLGSEAK